MQCEVVLIYQNAPYKLRKGKCIDRVSWTTGCVVVVVSWRPPVLVQGEPYLFIFGNKTMAKSVADLRKLQRNQIGRLTKDELIESILAEPERDNDILAVLTDKVTSLVTEVTELRNTITSPDSCINKKITELQVKVDKQAEIISKQQRFLEMLDRKERETNLVITGVPDEHESLEGATSEEDKVGKIWTKVGVQEEIKSHRRLGNRNDATGNRRRPILVTLANKVSRDKVLEKTRKLKEAGPTYSKIYIKKDVHPNVRNEWKRLRDAEKKEQDRPENVGCVIRLDPRERKLYRDGVVIDSWKQDYF